MRMLSIWTCICSKLRSFGRVAVLDSSVCFSAHAIRHWMHVERVTGLSKLIPLHIIMVKHFLQLAA